MTTQSEKISPSAGVVGKTASRWRWPDQSSGLRAVNSLPPSLLGDCGLFSCTANSLFFKNVRKHGKGSEG